jgi:hypothetical protein
MKNRNINFGAMLFVLVCFAALPQMRAAPDVAPSPDGCYPGYTTAEGCNALHSLTTGVGNTALGWGSLSSLTTSSYNTGVGAGALLINTSVNNTAVGAAALLLNTSGQANTAMGTDALAHNDTGEFNTAAGAFALDSNTTGGFNSAYGHDALIQNINGQNNSAFGDEALSANRSGSSDTAVGAAALYNCQDCYDNVAIGDSAGNNVVHGNGNIYVGKGVVGPADEALFIRIGNANVSSYDTFIAGIYNRAYGPADMAVRIGSNGKLGTVVSSRRFKHDIKPMDKASEAIMALKPVTFQYNSDATNAPRFGLIAEDVAEVSRELVIPDKDGKPLSVRYEDVNVMLLNEFLKEHKKVDKLQATVANLVATVKEQATQIQEVSAQLEASKRAAKLVANDQ